MYIHIYIYIYIYARILNVTTWRYRLEVHKHCSIHRVSTLRPRQNIWNFADDIFKRIFWNEYEQISIKFHWCLFLGVQLTILQHLVRIMAYRLYVAKPLSEPTMISLLTHICVTRSQWVNTPKASAWPYFKPLQLVYRGFLEHQR